MIGKKDYAILRDMGLPKWLEDQVPEPLPCIYISYENGRYFVSNNWSSVDYIVDAYNYALRMQNEYQVLFDPSVDGNGGTLEKDHFIATTTRNTQLVLPALSTEDNLFWLKKSYYTWLIEYAMQYEENPDDFFTAYTWLAHHPLFWTKRKTEKSYDWITDKGLQELVVNVHLDTEKKPVFVLGHGGHHQRGFRTDSEYTKCYYDYRLAVSEEGYEQGIVALAKRVHAVYDLDGYER